ncbi:MAG: isoprenyl transferase [Deltaproteobacteria bacterium]|nr:isoprenyl transferase [Deltaproteobacteria bacterium]MBW2053359.1 isoprenyl transferase [Deltaproteobacteria bacterium]MBW2140145.1 isoprenyl transferase [Deltaproteobacteria bacterium]
MTVEDLDLQKLPRHVAVIMDGNGRWAEARGLSRIEGHRAGAKPVRTVTQTCRELGIENLTLFAFSSENWNRPRAEVEALMKLLNRYLKRELNEMLKNGIRLKTIGDLSRLSRPLQKLLHEAMKETANNNKMVLSLALNYGGRQDILQAVKAIGQACGTGRLKPEDLTEDVINNFLYTAGLPDPDLLIRTSGEYRFSNFLLWQIAYTEFYFTPTLWPDFSKEELIDILKDFQQRQRRFGKTGAQFASKQGS